MGIAFAAVALFVLAAPGIAFHRSARRLRHLRRHPPVAEQIAAGVLAAALAHFAGLPAARWVCHHFALPVRPDFQSALVLASGQFGREPDTVGEALRSVGDHVGWVVGYFVLVILGAWLAGKCWGRVVNARWLRRWEDDPKVRRHDAWDAKLNPALKGKGGVLTHIAVVLGSGDDQLLYTGFLDEVFFDDEGRAEAFWLQSVERSAFPSAAKHSSPGQLLRGEEAEPDLGLPGQFTGSTSDAAGGPPEGRGPERAVPVDGQYLVVRAADASTINVTYQLLEPVREGTFWPRLRKRRKRADKARETAAAQAPPAAAPPAAAPADTSAAASAGSGGSGGSS